MEFSGLFDGVLIGFGAALTPQNLLFCFIGVLIGTLVGVLPGIGPIPALAMLLPLTFYLPPIPAIIMLAGIYYGSQYGGSTTAILVNLPGESSSVVTCLDGYQMAQRGRAGAALAVAALGSFFAGTVTIVLIFLASPPLSGLALQFGAAEYFSLALLGLVGAVVLAQGSIPKAVGMLLVGLLLSLVGNDVNSGQDRFTFGRTELLGGLSFVPVAMGFFGLTEILANLERRYTKRTTAIVGRLWPSREEFGSAWPAVLRGTTVGSILGLLPGGGALLASFAAYSLEKRIAKDPSRFGKGAVEGVAAPEAANNAGAQVSFIPLLTLGIPSNAVMALMVGALIIQGITPGPRVITDRPDLFWGLVASMWIGNVLLLIVNLPLIGIWVWLLKIPYRLLFPSILLICSIGVYSLNNSSFDVAMMALFAFVGYVFYKLGCEPAPLILGFILGPIMEENLRRAVMLSRGDPLIFFERPISLSLILTAVVLLALVLLPSFRKTRTEAFKEG